MTSAARAAAAEKAVDLVEPGMVVGLGTGDTAGYAIRAIAARRLDITGVPTSRATAALAAQLGIRLVEPDAVAALDLTIDGADEIDGALRLVKGGGGALTRERLVARASRAMAVVVDRGKRVTRLGERYRLPVEILPFGVRWTLARLAALGLEPVPRAGVVSDGGGVIADCTLGAVKQLPGVVDHGIFLDEASVAFIGADDGSVEVISRALSREGTPAR